MAQMQSITTDRIDIIQHAGGLTIDSNAVTPGYVFKVDASKRGNFFTRLYKIVKYLFTGILEI